MRNILLAIILFQGISGFAEDNGALTTVRELNGILRKENKKIEKIEKKLKETIDTSSIAEEAISPWIKKVSRQKVEEYRSLFEDIFLKSSLKKILKQKADKVKYRSTSCSSNKKCEVRTVLRYKGEETEIVYFLKLSKMNKWKVYDISIDGIKLTENYRKQFSKIIKEKGFDELINKLKKKLKGL